MLERDYTRRAEDKIFHGVRKYIKGSVWESQTELFSFLNDGTLLPYKQNLGRAGSGDSHARIRYGESTNFGRDLMKPVYFFLGRKQRRGLFLAL